MTLFNSASHFFVDGKSASHVYFNGAVVWSTPTTGVQALSDPFRPLLSNGTTISNWNLAPSGNWVQVTSTEYRNITASIANIVKKGHTELVINTRESSTTFGGQPLLPSTPDTSQSLVTMESGEYLVALVFETWNQASLASLGYVKTFVSGAPEAFPVSASLTGGGARAYFVRKAGPNMNNQFTPVTESLIPVYQYVQSPNAVAVVNGRAYRYSSSLSSDPVWVVTPSPKVQLIFSTDNPWG